MRHEERGEGDDALHTAERGEALLEKRSALLSFSYTGAVTQRRSTERPAAVASRFPASLPGLVNGPPARAGPSRPRPPNAASGSAADDLPEDGQVGPDAVALLRSAPRDPEASCRLVEASRRRGLAEPSQRLEKTGSGGRRPCFRHRLDDDHRQALTVAHHRVRDRLHDVVRDDGRLGGGPVGAPGVDEIASVASAEPALARSASTCPW